MALLQGPCPRLATLPFVSWCSAHPGVRPGLWLLVFATLEEGRVHAFCLLPSSRRGSPC